MKLDIKDILPLSQDNLLIYCYFALLDRKYKEKNLTYTEDYVYAKGNIPILLVAHTDVVHRELPALIVHDKEQDILWSPTGIGGDDRCGVYAILKICEKYKPYVLFTTGEEKGGLGAKKFVEEIEELPVNFIIEIDRRGNNQVVFYQCENQDFRNYILSFGFDLNYGSYSDVSTLSREYDIAGCNLSAGYYNEHTTNEHIFLDHLQNTIEKVKQILDDKENHKFYDCQEKKYDYSKYDYTTIYDDYDYYDGYYYKKNKKSSIYTKNFWKKAQEVEDDWYDLTEAQWEEKYKVKRPLDLLKIYEMEELYADEI